MTNPRILACSGSSARPPASGGSLLRRRLRRSLALASTLALTALARPADAKKDESKDDIALRADRKALQLYVAGDSANAARILELALRVCETSKGCSESTRSRLHVSLGTVRGAGQGDYAAAKKEFITAIAIDPSAKLSPALSNQKLESVFADARTSVSPSEQPDKSGQTVPDRPLTVSELLHPEENGEPNGEPKPRPKTEPKKPEPTGPEPRFNWVSARAMVDFTYLSDANICSPGAPDSYFCANENGQRYTGIPQPNDNVSSGFASSSGRLVLGYERLLFGGLTAGAFAGFAFPFASSPEGRSSMFPLHLEVRGTYTFGEDPYADEGARIHPFVYGSLGMAEYDSHVIIRIYEIPCQSRVAPACKHDLDVYRRTGRIFATLGGGVRLRVEGRHALRAAMRGTLVFDGAFVVSPEIAYELGL